MRRITERGLAQAMGQATYTRPYECHACGGTLAYTANGACAGCSAARARAKPVSEAARAAAALRQARHRARIKAQLGKPARPAKLRPADTIDDM